jgi:hypothetical protein
MKNLLIAIMIASMYLLCSSIAFATEQRVVGVERHGNSVTIVYEGGEQKVVNSSTEVIEPVVAEVSSAAIAAFEVEAKTLEVSTVSKPVNDFVKFMKENTSLDLGMSFQMQEGADTSGQPIGFLALSRKQGSGAGLVMEASIPKYRIGLEYRPFPVCNELESSFYGSSLGSPQSVCFKNVIIGKVYLVHTSKYKLSAGWGVMQVSVNDNISLGGVKFPNSGAGSYNLFQLGGQYRFNRRFALGIDWEKFNVPIGNQIPGVPKLVTTYNDRLLLKAMLMLWGPK